MVVDLKFLKLEVFTKLVTKMFGVARMFFILYFIGFSKELDSIFLIQSIAGIVLLLNIFIELNFSNRLLSSILKNDHSVYKVFWSYILLLSGAYLIITLIYFFFIDSLSSNFLIILIFLIASIFNIIGYLGMIESRLQNLKTKVILYYFLTSFGLLFHFIFFYWILSDGYSHFSIPLSVLVTDLLVVLLMFKNVFFKIILAFRGMHLKWDRNFTTSIFVIGIFVLIDSTDKFFLKSFGSGILSAFSYGLYITIVARSILDVRSNFNAKLTSLKNEKKKIKTIFYKYLFILIKFYSYFLVALFVCVWFLSYHQEEIMLIFGVLNISMENTNLLLKISLLGIIFYAPLYLIFDLTYRIYYAVNDLRFIFKISLIAFFINIILNQFFGIFFQLGAIGILLSSILVFSFLVITGLNYIKKLNPK